MTKAVLRVDGLTKLVIDPDTERTYFLVDGDIHRRAMDALRRQQDHDAIAQGIAELESGEGLSVENARKLTQERLTARGK